MKFFKTENNEIIIDDNANYYYSLLCYSKSQYDDCFSEFDYIEFNPKTNERKGCNIDNDNNINYFELQQYYDVDGLLVSIEEIANEDEEHSFLALSNENKITKIISEIKMTERWNNEKQTTVFIDKNGCEYFQSGFNLVEFI